MNFCFHFNKGFGQLTGWSNLVCRLNLGGVVNSIIGLVNKRSVVVG